jgi:hypothetical protein
MTTLPRPSTRSLVRGAAVGAVGAVLALGLAPGATATAQLPAAPTQALTAPAHHLDPAVLRCLRIARMYGDGRAVNLATATITVGTPWADEVVVGDGPAAPGEKIPVWCGFAGDDGISDSWGYVYGGPGDDGMGENWLVFRGGPGDDSVSPNEAFFDGGPGDDTAGPNAGTFLGGWGNDTVVVENSGLFVGGPGRDRVEVNSGTVRGGTGNDVVEVNWGVFDGGPGYDVVLENHGTCLRVEKGC